MRSLWRQKLYKELSEIELTGNVLDLGGSHNSLYHSLFRGDCKIAVANLDDGQDKEYTFDFEKSFPLEANTFDGIVCLNVLEHIFNYQNLLLESHRILKTGGTMVIGVPFLIRYHLSPDDYWRYTESTLKRILTEAGYTTVEVKPVGTGPFGAAYSLLHNTVRFSLLQWFFMYLAVLLDRTISKIAPKSTLSFRNYPLGYMVTAKK